MWPWRDIANREYRQVNIHDEMCRVANFVVNIGADIQDWLGEIANFVEYITPIFTTKFKTSREYWRQYSRPNSRLVAHYFDRTCGREFISSTYAVFLTRGLVVNIGANIHEEFCDFVTFRREYWRRYSRFAMSLQGHHTESRAHRKGTGRSKWKWGGFLIICVVRPPHYSCVTLRRHLWI